MLAGPPATGAADADVVSLDAVLVAFVVCEHAVMGRERAVP